MAEVNQKVNSLELNMNSMGSDIKYIKKALDENKDEHKEILATLKGWKDEAERKFAPRWVADAMKFVMGVIAVGVIGAIMSIIIK